MDAFKMEKDQGLLLCLRDLQESPKGAAPLALSQKPLVASDRMEMCPPRPSSTSAHLQSTHFLVGNAAMIDIVSE